MTVNLQARDGAVRTGTRGSICARIAVWARDTPDHIAVIQGAARLSFAELDDRADRWADRLAEAGIGPGTCVGLFLDRSPEFVVAALAVLKAGAAYLPLDPATPMERAAFVLADAGAPLALTQRRKASQLAAGSWDVIEVDDLPSAAQAATRTGIEPRPDDLAYVVYTSGTTGRPKGVEITHANLENLVDWHVTTFGVTSADHASNVAGLAFDATGWEVWPALSAGASVHIADELVARSPQALRDWLVAEGVTIGFVPTVLAEQLVQSPWPAGTALRTMLTGADTLTRRPIPGLPFTLVNNYGPTECTVVATSGTVDPLRDGSTRPSIGRAISGATALILDEDLSPVAAGERGELCLAGALVGRGYRNNAELTAERFVTVVLPSGAAVRAYRTGDQARLLEGGEIEFLGRLDEQVKIRGYRVELGEVVSCLNLYPGVEASAVSVREVDQDAPTGAGSGFGTHLVAHVLPGTGAELTAADLREFLSARLPEYMVPSDFVAVAALPLTPNGKIEKARLPAPTVANRLPAGAGAEPSDSGGPGGSEGGVQDRLAALVAGLLGRTTVAPHENFFLAGGYSMLGVQLVLRIQQTFGVRLQLRQLFTSPTIAGITAAIEQAGR